MINTSESSDSSDSESYVYDVASSSSSSSLASVPSLMRELIEITDDDMHDYAFSTYIDSGSDEEFDELMRMHIPRKKLNNKEYLSPDDPESCTGEHKLIANFTDTICPEMFRITQPRGV